MVQSQDPLGDVGGISPSIQCYDQRPATVKKDAIVPPIPDRGHPIFHLGNVSQYDKHIVRRWWSALCLVVFVLLVASSQATSWHTLTWSLSFCGPFTVSNVVINATLGTTHEPYDKELLLSNGLTNQVQWDKYSFIVKGQRIFLHSGEFHTFRLPVPSLWLDILQKVKAAGLNGISVYTHWGLINPSPGIIDLDGFRGLQPLFDAAREAGLWIVLRPGPYINAETTAGGIAHWVTSEVAGSLRTNATDFRAAWQDYIHAIINVTVSNQITNGGPVIAVQVDNEYFQDGYGNREYFQQLEDVYRKHGIVVPLTYNDAGLGKNFVNGTGAVDIYGLDAYPQRFDCSHPQDWYPVATNYRDYHEDTNLGQPFYSPEFQAGAYDAWGPSAPGYPRCQELTGPSFQDVFYKSLWADNAKLINYYMIYGGTSWGAIPFHGVYTSYDYGSAISENRVLTSKYRDLKRQGLFLRSSADFYKTNWIGNSSTSAVNVSSPDAFVTLLSNPDSGSGFYIARQADSTSTDRISFKLDVKVLASIMTIPQTLPSITLAGRQAKVIVTDYVFGLSSTALYSTASVLFAGRIGNRDVLYLFGDSDQDHEAAIVTTGTSVRKASSTSMRYASSTTSNATIVSFLAGISGLITVWDSDSQLVLFSDIDTAGTFFAPVISGDGTSGDTHTFKNYWQFGTNASVLIGGPYLVRNASITGSELTLRGDLTESVRLTVIAPSEIESVTWNGQYVPLDRSAGFSLSFRGGIVGTLLLQNSAAHIHVPDLDDWKFADSLPEIHADFSDESWTIANRTTTNIPFPPYYGDGRILYGCDYRFCENVVIWRGHFNATGQEKSVNLSINGGEAFAASVWLNDIFLNTSYGNSSNNNNIIEETDDLFIFPDGAVISGQDNVITIVQDNMGLNETDEATDQSKSPRGIRGFKLNVGDFSEWKVQGKLGGYTKYPDKVRGLFNEGGTYGERLGWHLPGFDVSSWQNRSLSDGLPNSAAGIGFFQTTFDLHIPTDMDVPISFNFDDSSQPYRAYLFVNGWMMGKRVANLGPQIKFPVQQGILDYSGVNTVSLILWAMEPNTTVSPSVYLTIDSVIEGGVGGVITNNPRWTDRSYL